MRLTAATLLVAALAAGSSAATSLAEGAFATGEMTLMGDPAPVDVVSLEEAATGPKVPNIPALLDGIGPGSPIRMPNGLCSTAFLFQEPGQERYFLATAGHCLAPASGQSPVTGLGSPSAVVAWVDVCYIDCTGYSGTFVRLEPSAGYHPVAFATRSTGDFGLIAIPAQLNHLVRADLPVWGGPVDIAEPVDGDALLVYGHGNSICNGCGVHRTPADQARIGLETPVGHMAPTATGDSGGLVSVLETREDGTVVTHAYGLVTGPVVREPGGFEGGPVSTPTVDGPLFRAMPVASGIAMAEPLMGFLPALVPGSPAFQP